MRYAKRHSAERAEWKPGRFTEAKGPHMNSKLLAFRVARPIEAAGDDLMEYSYDPQTQTAVWGGNGKAAAYLYCSYAASGRSGCNAYANYCTTWGGAGHKKCD
jgi:hypothetical protein